MKEIARGRKMRRQPRERGPSWAGEAGQGLVEYALIFTLIVIVAIVSLAFLGGNVSTYLSAIGTSI